MVRPQLAGGWYRGREVLHTLRYHGLLPWLHLPPATGRAAFLLHKTYFSATAGGVSVTTSSAHASIHAEEALQAPPIPPAPWMPLGPLTELWAAFGREATNPAAALAVSRAFAALADEREAVAPTWLPSASQPGVAVDPPVFSLLVAQEAIIEALSQAATHWYEATRALLDYAEQPLTGEEQEESPALDLEALISYILAQRVRVWAIAHSLLAEQLQLLFPHQQKGSEGSA